MTTTSMPAVAVDEQDPHQPDRAPLPPQDLEAEQSVLGACLLSATAISDVVGIVRSEDFYRPAHQAIYAHVLRLYGHGEPVDAVTMRAALEEAGELARCGDGPYLHTLIAMVPTAANADYYAEIVADRALRRRIIETTTSTTQEGYQGQGDAVGLLDRAQAHLSEVGRAQGEDFHFVQQLAAPFMDGLERIQSGDGPPGVPTGFADLDAVTHGLHPGQLVVIGARPGVGKSSLALDLCRSAAIRHQMGAGIFSLEMGRDEIMMRLLSAESRTRLSAMRGGTLTDEDWARLARRTGEVQDAPLAISDSPNLTMMEIRAQARRLKQRHDIKLLVVDYLQLMTTGKRVESRQQEVAEFSRQLKLLAKELEVPVVALSQLNRGPEQRADRVPQLSDLRESGAVEQDSDVVILLHRPDAFERDDPRMGEADLILAKHRAGPQTTVTVAHQLHYSRFVDMAQE